MNPTVNELTPILQIAIGPVILISGVGLLLLTMTNRLGRVIDRSRILAGQLITASEVSRFSIEEQLEILMRRARLVRTAISLVSMSALAAALLVIVLFLTVLFHWEAGWLIVFLFVVCMGCLSASLIVFIQDINQSLAALKLEMRSAEAQRKKT